MAVVVPKHNTCTRCPCVDVWIDVRGWHAVYLVKKHLEGNNGAALRWFSCVSNPTDIKQQKA